MRFRGNFRDRFFLLTISLYVTNKTVKNRIFLWVSLLAIRTELTKWFCAHIFAKSKFMRVTGTFGQMLFRRGWEQHEKRIQGNFICQKVFKKLCQQLKDSEMLWEIEAFYIYFQVLVYMRWWSAWNCLFTF